MRSSCGIAVVLAVTALAGACGGDGIAPSNTPPAADFASACALLACTFADASSDADGRVVAYAWDFGDGGLAATADASHTFASAGTYEVELIVTDDGGAIGKLSQQVRVEDAPSPMIGIVAIAQILTNLCYPARAYSTRGCPSGASASISNTGGGTLNWTSTSSAPWLKRSPSSGTAPTAMRIWVDGKDLPRGSYSGQITIMAEEATNSPRSISVHVTRD